MYYKLVNKNDFWWCRLIGKVFPSFLTDISTTVGSTIYVCANWNQLSAKDAKLSLEHETTHVLQFSKYIFPIMSFLYLFFPLPVGLAYFRYRMEREAYFNELVLAREMCLQELGDWSKERERLINWVVSVLGSGMYLWPWPKSWIRKWFEKNLRKD